MKFPWKGGQPLAEVEAPECQKGIRLTGLPNALLSSSVCSSLLSCVSSAVPISSESHLQAAVCPSPPPSAPPPPHQRGSGETASPPGAGRRGKSMRLVPCQITFLSAAWSMSPRSSYRSRDRSWACRLCRIHTHTHPVRPTFIHEHTDRHTLTHTHARIRCLKHTLKHTRSETRTQTHRHSSFCEWLPRFPAVAENIGKIMSPVIWVSVGTQVRQTPAAPTSQR